MAIEDIFRQQEFQLVTTLDYTRRALGVIHTRQNYLGPLLFPAENIDDLDWSYIKGANAVPIPEMAGIKAISGATRVAQRSKALTKVAGEIPSIARKIDVDPKTIIKMDRALRGGLTDEYRSVVGDIYNDLDNMTAQVAARLEWLRMQCLSKGAFTYSEEGVTFQVDYGVPAALQKNVIDDTTDFTTNVSWNTTGSSDPIDNLQEALQIYEDVTGTRPGRILSSAKLFRLARQADATNLLVNGSNFSGRHVTIEQFRTLLSNEEVPPWATYDVKVRSEAEDGSFTESRLIQEDRLIFLPPGDIAIGNTLFAPTVEEVLNRMGQDVGAFAAADPTAPRLWGQVYVEGKDPGTLWTKAIANAFPTFPSADLVMYVDVLAGA